MEKEKLEKLIPQNILEAKPYFPPTDRKNFIRLDLNESYHFLSDAIINDLKQFDHFTLSSYPEYAALTAEVARYSGRSSEEVCLTSGSDQAIEMLLNLFFHKGDEVIVPAPTFFVYFSLLELIGASAKVILHKDEEDHFVFPFEETLNAITASSKGLLLCNPNNPLGSSIPEKEMTILVEKAHAFGIPVIIDEAYFEFSGSTAAKLLDHYDNLIILRSFSKSFGLAGLRLGYVLAHKNIIDELVKLRLPWAVNHFAVHGGIVALKHQKHFKEKIAETLETKKSLIDFLEGKGAQCYRSDTNFIIAKFSAAKHLVEALKRRGLLVSDVSHYPHSGDLLANALRITVPSQADFPRVQQIFEESLFEATA
jgi:histidinol-phosphate aminotransferase